MNKSKGSPSVKQRKEKPERRGSTEEAPGTPTSGDVKHREYRCVVMGSGGVGKSALTVRYTSGPFVSSYDPTVEDSYLKHIEFDGVACTLDIMDTAGQENYRALTESYMKKGQSFMVVFSVVSKISFDFAKKVKADIIKVKEDYPDTPIVLVGNKIDLPDREVSDEVAEAWIEKECTPNSSGKPPCARMLYMPTSAKENTNVASAFETVIKLTNQFRDAHPELQPQVPGALKKKRCTLF